MGARLDRILHQASEAAWLFAVFPAAFWAAVHRMGASPSIWQDTLIEDSFVDRCLRQNDCTIVGPGATVGIYHSAGYMHWRALLMALGFGVDGTHLAILAVTALAIAVVAYGARRTDGPAAAAIAAIVLACSVGIPTQLDVTTDVAPLPFIGSVFLLVGLATVRARHLGVTVLLGLVGAVAADTYATGLLCGVSGLWIVMLLPDRRLRHAALFAATFAIATFVIAPGSWITDAWLLLTHGRSIGSGNPVVGRSLRDIPLFGLSALAAAIWLGAVAARRPVRARLGVAAAVLVPVLLPLAVGSASGKLSPQDKYLAQVLPAMAFILGVGAATLARTVIGALARLLPRRAAAEVEQRPRVLIAAVAPLVAAGAVAAYGMGAGAVPSSFGRAMTYGEIARAQAVLRAEGWTLARATRDLKLVDDIAARLAVADPAAWAPSGDAGSLERVYMVKEPLRRLPASVPSGVQFLGRSSEDATMLARTCSWIDWSSFRVCVSRPGVDGETCTDSGLPEAYGPVDRVPGLAGMPAIDMVHPASQVMTIHFPLHPGPGCPVFEVYLPRMPMVCVGHVAGVDGGAASVDPSGRRVRITVPPDGPPPRELVVAWEIGGPTCWTQYRGLPPFFLEGSPEVVSFLKPTVTWEGE